MTLMDCSSYGDGSGASGIVGNDKVVIGGVAIASQAVELADKLSTQFQQSAGDGLLGLAFGTINTVKPTPVKTPVENIGGNQLFSAYLGSVGSMTLRSLRHILTCRCAVERCERPRSRPVLLHFRRH